MVNNAGIFKGQSDNNFFLTILARRCRPIKTSKTAEETRRMDRDAECKSPSGRNQPLNSNISKIYVIIFYIFSLCKIMKSCIFTLHFPCRPPRVNVGHKVREAPLSQRSLLLVGGPGPRRGEPPQRRPGPLRERPRM